jgi:hypothetical protein
VLSHIYSEIIRKIAIKPVKLCKIEGKSDYRLCYNQTEESIKISYVWEKLD